MPRDYLREFRDFVCSVHDLSGATCHWTALEEMTSNPALLSQDEPGPCDCPIHRISGQSCNPDHGYNCLETTRVLGIITAAETQAQGLQPDSYGAALRKLAAHMEPLEAALAKGDELIRNELKAGKSFAEALAPYTFDPLRVVMRSHYDDLKDDIKYILNLTLFRHCSRGASPAGIKCPQCYANKQTRLRAEERLTETLIEQAAKESDALSAIYADQVPKYDNTLGPVLHGCLAAVEGVLTGDSELAAEGADQLIQYYTDSLKDGARIYFFLKELHELGEIKKLAMLGVIYHDQQLEATTCQQSPQRPPGVVPQPEPTHIPPPVSGQEGEKDCEIDASMLGSGSSVRFTGGRVEVNWDIAVRGQSLTDRQQGRAILSINDYGEIVNSTPGVATFLAQFRADRGCKRGYRIKINLTLVLRDRSRHFISEVNVDLPEKALPCRKKQNITWAGVIERYASLELIFQLEGACIEAEASQPGAAADSPAKDQHMGSSAEGNYGPSKAAPQDAAGTTPRRDR